MKKGLLTAIATAAALGGCAGTDALSARMAGFEQDRVEAAIEAWGEPEERVAVDGGTLLTWRDRVDDGYAAGTAPVVCVRMLAVDASGTITGWRWRGDACPFIDTTPANSSLLAASAASK